MQFDLDALRRFDETREGHLPMELAELTNQFVGVPEDLGEGDAHAAGSYGPPWREHAPGTGALHLRIDTGRA
jgi:hypothetical protein